MAQLKTYSFTSAASLAAVDINVGFSAARVTVYNFTAAGSVTNPGSVLQSVWTDTMAQASALNLINTAGAATVTSATITSNGISVISDSATYGSSISAYTNANPCVITVGDAVGAGFAVGDTVRVAEMAYSGAGTNPNTTYTIVSISGNAITTATNTTSFGVRVSGGNLFRVSDSAGKAVSILNRAQLKVRLGTGVQTASSVCHVVIEGKNSVV